MDNTLGMTTVMTSLTFLLAGFVKGVVGMGLPTVAVGLLGLVMPPAKAAALLVVPSLVTNVWQLATGPGIGMLLRRLWPMLVGFCAGAAMGAGNLSSDGADLSSDGAGRAGMLLGMALVVYALIGLFARRLTVPPRYEPWLSPVIGVMTGVITASTGVFVIPAVPYLQALDLRKDELVQALGLSFTVSTIALAVVLAVDGSFRPAVAAVSFLALLPALGGMFAGQWLRARIRPETFRKCFFAGLLLLGAHLALRTLVTA